MAMPNFYNSMYGYGGTPSWGNYDANYITPSLNLGYQNSPPSSYDFGGSSLNNNYSLGSFGSLGSYGVGEGNPFGSIDSAMSASGGGGWFDSLKTKWSDNKSLLVGDKDAPGVIPMGIGALQGIGNLYMGMKQYGLAKDQMNLAKQTSERNYQAQKSMVNSELEDRQRARVASNSNYMSVNDYMNKYGVK